MVYDNRHRAILQAVMQGGAVHDLNVKLLCAKIFGPAADRSSVILSINDKLGPIAMTLKSGVCELTGQKYWCVVGTTHEDSVEFQSEFSKQQRAFLRVVYSEIISSDDGFIASTDCLNLTHKLDVKLSTSDADAFLKKATHGKWLHYQGGAYFMGIRSIVELMPYFRATYQDNFHNCQLCKDVMFHGHKCEHCNQTYHFDCISRKIADLETDKCPNCSKDMDCSEIIEFNNTQQLNQNQASQSMVARQNGDEPMDVSEDVIFSQPKGVAKKSKRKTRANE